MKYPNNLVDIQPPRPPWELLHEEIAALRASKPNRDAVSFAIEAIRINISCACFKDETLLLEAMQGLEKEQPNG